MFNTNELLGQRYEILKAIGDGGMANVYLGYDTILQREVAIKVLRGDLASDDKFVKRFQREALSATSLNHPNIVQLYDVGEYHGKYFIVMEYVQGKTLKQVIRERGPLQIAEAVNIMKQLTAGMAHAHERSIIHRDIKPQNILVKSDGTVKITDFGIAIASNAVQLTHTNSVMGSVHYLAPELARGEHASFQSDMYALGIVFYEILKGDVPFEGDSPVNIALMHMQQDMPKIMEFNPEVPQAVENIITYSTMKDKRYRYNSIEEMLADVSTCLDDDRKEEEPIEFEEIEDEEGNVTIVANREKNLENKKLDKRLKTTMMILGGILGAMVLLILVLLLSGLFSPRTVMIPDLKNELLEDAKEMLIDLELEIGTITEEYSEDIEKGKVIKTDPPADSKIQKGETVKIYVSMGQERLMPDLVGRTLEASSGILTDLGVTYRVVEAESDLPENTVIEQFPAPDTNLSGHNEVLITVSRGNNVNMPSVVGKIFREARDLLTSYGLSVTTTNCEDSFTVSSQSALVNALVRKGSTITLTCTIPEPTPPPPPTVPEEPEQPRPEE